MGFASRKTANGTKLNVSANGGNCGQRHKIDFLKKKGMEVGVSHESLEVQGIDREPTIPLGRAAMALERKGIRTENGDKNREIEIRNREREEEKHLLRREKNNKRDRGRSR